jgi:hypothetical protein
MTGIRLWISAMAAFGAHVRICAALNFLTIRRIAPGRPQAGQHHLAVVRDADRVAAISSRLYGFVSAKKAFVPEERTREAGGSSNCFRGMA